MKSLKKILLLRFSAMGDAALLLPVVKAVVATHPDVEITVVTRPKFASFFTDIDRVVPFPADVDYTYSGILGLRDLFGKLIRRGTYDVVIDAHDSIRTRVLRFLFRVIGVRNLVIDKSRADRKALVRSKDKIRKPLQHTVLRYLELFRQAGFDAPLAQAPYLHIRQEIETDANNWVTRNQLVKEEIWIGIAPFAKHKSKIWPLENYQEVIRQLSSRVNVKFFLFGGGDQEVKALQQLADKVENAMVVAGQLKIKQELAFMRRMDLMITTDSANMHLAMLLNVPLISIWGGTHTDGGFGPFGLGEESILESDTQQITCRPCSVFGTSTCARKDFACLTTIKPEMLVNKILNRLHLSA